ncbi:MAG TPA: two-component regulator propeller domain-containing protein [Cytophagales bacterium]|nr:two-component regulator propeller domain-containing protein [Cytophagales bacterium]
MKCYIFFLIGLFIHTSVYSQKHNLKFKHIGTDQGLSHSNVIRILQDSEGFMWFATRDGLNKYDGYNFTIYKNNPNDPHSLSINNTKRIIEDKEGYLWVTTWGGGINKFDKEKESFTQYRHDENNPNSLSDDFVHSVLEDHKGNLWLGTDVGGLNLFDRKTNKFTHYINDPNDSTSISNNKIRDIFEDSNHNLWIATENGLNLFDREKKTFKRFKNNPSDPNSLSNNHIRVVFEDSHKNLWIGSYGGGLELFDYPKGKFTHFKNDPKNSNTLPNNQVIHMAEDDEGYLWVGLENGGLSIFNPLTKEFNNYLQDELDEGSLSNNSIYTIYKDKKGNMWVGTFNDGLNFVSKDVKFKHYRHNSSPRSLSHNLVLCIYEDSKNNLWVSTDGGGLNLMDRKKGEFTHFKHEEGNPNSICGNYVISITEDGEGNIWLGTWGDGVTVFNPEKKTYKHFKNNPKDPNSLGSNNIWKVFTDKEKNVWIGTYGKGLELFDKKNNSFIHFTSDLNDPTTVSYNNIFNIFEDSKGYLWISTDGGGLNKFDKKTQKFKRYTHSKEKHSLSHNTAGAILEDTLGNLWIGTDEGLDYLNTKTDKIISYHSRDGLPNDVIYGILDDEKGNLWISTNHGLSKFNPSSKTFKNFSSADGLQSNEFKRHAFCKSSSGILYFGGKNGFNEFHPDSVVSDSFDPPLVLTGFYIFNKPVPVATSNGDFSLPGSITKTKEITLSYDQSVFSLQFASLNYTVPEKKQYSYKLEGFDKEWHEVGATRTATYTNLDPGSYTFRVRGLNNGGNWSKNEIALKINIEPPFWKTLWFKLILGFSIASLSVVIFNLRVNAIRKQKQELEQQVKIRTLELEEANNELVTQKEEIESQREYIQDIYNETKDSILAAQEIQMSILPSENYIKKHLPESFVLNKPKDVVSGDFYWFDIIDGKIVIAVVDCTGHGVSGAFMSLLAHNLLNQTIYGETDLIASEVLDKLNTGLIKELHQKNEDSKIRDGMDIALCIIDKNQNSIQYAGANIPLYLLRNKELIEIKADRFPIGFSVRGKIKKYTNHHVDLQEGDTIYLFSDGYVDQIGGESGDEKFMYPRFRELLVKNGDKNLNQQLKALDENFEKWKMNVEQLDDIMVIGFKV